MSPNDRPVPKHLKLAVQRSDATLSENGPFDLPMDAFTGLDDATHPTDTHSESEWTTHGVEQVGCGYDCPSAEAVRQTLCDLDPDFWNHTGAELALLRGNGRFAMSTDAPSVLNHANDLIDTESDSEERSQSESEEQSRQSGSEEGSHKSGSEESLQQFEGGRHDDKSPLAHAEEKSFSVQKPLKVDLDALAQHWQHGRQSDNGRFIASVDVLEAVRDAIRVIRR